MHAFVNDVADWLGLGPAGTIDVAPMVGSANRLWRFRTSDGDLVVKELSHDAPDDLHRRRGAAAFERAVFERNALAMAEPLIGQDGELVALRRGSRGDAVPVRAHRWLEGAVIGGRGTAVLGSAGASLHLIQEVGAGWSTKDGGSLRRWDEDPLAVAKRLRASAHADVGARALQLGTDALDLIAEAESTSGPWVYSHLDHKPENSLAVSGLRVAVLDWDECGHCHRRLEVVESALRWSQVGDDRATSFRTFLDGYRAAGGDLPRLVPSDFGKWVAALLGWFSFQARRALGDFPTDTQRERSEAAAMAAATVGALRETLESVSEWARWS